MIRTLALLSTTFLAAACVAEPAFVLSEDGAQRASAGAGDDDMVLIPTTVLSSPGGLAPTKNEDKDKKGKGKGGEDPPPPAPSVTTVPAFLLDVREVSAAAYAACAAEGACTAAGLGAGCTAADPALGDHPINCVTLEQARSFCRWQRKRLVGDLEWTAAAAGSSARPYPWGEGAPSPAHLNACGAECAAPAMYAESDGFVETAPGASFPGGASPEGVFDLAGNVAEWVELESESVARGGSFEDREPSAVASTAARVVARGGQAPAIGFRCAKDE